MTCQEFLDYLYEREATRELATVIAEAVERRTREHAAVAAG